MTAEECLLEVWRSSRSSRQYTFSCENTLLLSAFSSLVNPSIGLSSSYSIEMETVSRNTERMEERKREKEESLREKQRRNDERIRQ